MKAGHREWAWRAMAGGLALATISFAVPSHPMRADESVPMKDVPEAVRATAGAKLGALDACKASKEKEHGKVRWEIEKPVEGGVQALIISDAGDLMEVEQPVAVEKVPKAVRDAIAATFPKGTVVLAESVETHAYEVTLTVDGKKRHVKVALDGAIANAKDDEADEEGGK